MENETSQTSIAENKENEHRLIALEHLLEECDAAEWEDKMEYLLDNLIAALDNLPGDILQDSMYHVRVLQKFFKKIQINQLTA